MTIPAAYLDELRSRVSLVELIGRAVKLERNGREYLGLCPFHNEKTPSFNIVPAKGFYHCFGCGAHGGAIDFVMRREGVDFLEAVARLAGVAGMRLPEGVEPSAAPVLRQARPAPERLAPAEIDAEEKMKREEARGMYLAARLLEPGDPVWRYLVDERCVDLPAFGRLPSAIRFHPRLYHKKLDRYFPAMVAAISDESAEAGGHLATHCTYFDVSAERVIKILVADKSLQRRCYGSYRGGSIKLTRGASGRPWRRAPEGDRAISGEGIEDTLVGAGLFPSHRSFAGISGGNYKNIVLPPNIREIVLLYQNDERKNGSPDWWPLATAHFQGLGVRVLRLRPPVFVKDLNELAQWARRVGALGEARGWLDEVAGELAA